MSVVDRTIANIIAECVRLNDVVNSESYIADGEYNPHRVRPRAITDEHGILAVVYAACEQDAIDEAANNGRLDSCLISAEDQAAASEEERQEWLLAGNASEPFDQSYLSIHELPNMQYDSRYTTAG